MGIFEYDRETGIDISRLCGVDEAGRGPLAGDVYAAAVILKPNCIIEGLDDSKKLTEKKREELYNIIIENAVSYCVGIATIEEIEAVNILNATFLAMNRAVDGLDVTPLLCLVDGNQNPHLDVHSRCIIKGDSTSACIAAASILAKVSRDRYMKTIAEQYPQYQFEKHKGYGTALHYKMLDEHGISDVHRRSFLKKYLSGEKNNLQKETKTRGQIGEDAAVEYLLLQGYNIIERNISSSYGEIDIIVQKENIISFVEVKARKEQGLVSAREAVSKSKQKKIIITAVKYLQENEIKLQPRFDVIEIYFNGMKNDITQINCIENAFSGDGLNVFI